jgi:uncharacterized protein YndB with AHSA1/START domain
MTGVRIVRHEILIHAPADVVFAHLTDPAALLTWIAESAESDPVPGGGIRWTFADGSVMRGRYVTVEPPSRLVFRYGWDGGLMGVPPESTVVEIDLAARADGTLLTLTHRALPDEAAEQHSGGWEFFLRRLAVLLGPGRPD